MPSRPRSDAEFTLRSSTGPCRFPFSTRCTLPLAFSNTKMSFGPRNAILVGWSSPVTTVLTMRLSSSIVGDAAAGWIKVVIFAELLLVSKSVSDAPAVAVLTIDPVDDGVTIIVMTAVAPNDRFPNAQFTGPVPLHEP